MRDLTREDRVAATECIQLIGLLVDAKTPHAKDLAAIVSMRLVAIVQDGIGDPADDEQIAEWFELGRQLVVEKEQVQ